MQVPNLIMHCQFPAHAGPSLSDQDEKQGRAFFLKGIYPFWGWFKGQPKGSQSFIGLPNGRQGNTPDFFSHEFQVAMESRLNVGLSQILGLQVVSFLACLKSHPKNRLFFAWSEGSDVRHQIQAASPL